MQRLDVEHCANEALEVMVADPELARFVNCKLDIPKVYCGTGEIRLIFLGQDPTVKNARSRAKIKTVLNLDRKGGLLVYLAQICAGLGVELKQHVYATNYLKNFFVRPPTQITEVDVFQMFGPRWLPLLRDELSEFPRAPVITLGQPLLGALVHGGASPFVRDYWGYTPGWKLGEAGPFSFLRPDENQLDRIVFPYPHQPSIRKQFYKQRLQAYTAYVRNTIEYMAKESQPAS